MQWTDFCWNAISEPESRSFSFQCASTHSRRLLDIEQSGKSCLHQGFQHHAPSSFAEYFFFPSSFVRTIQTHRTICTCHSRMPFQNSICRKRCFLAFRSLCTSRSHDFAPASDIFHNASAAFSLNTAPFSDSSCQWPGYLPCSWPGE